MICNMPSVATHSRVARLYLNSPSTRDIVDWESKATLFRFSRGCAPPYLINTPGIFDLLINERQNIVDGMVTNAFLSVMSFFSFNSLLSRCRVLAALRSTFSVCTPQHIFSVIALTAWEPNCLPKIFCCSFRLRFVLGMQRRLFYSQYRCRHESSYTACYLARA